MFSIGSEWRSALSSAPTAPPISVEQKEARAAAVGDLFDAVGRDAFAVACAVTGDRVSAERVVEACFAKATDADAPSRVTTTELLGLVHRASVEHRRAQDSAPPVWSDASVLLAELTPTETAVIACACYGGRTRHEIALALELPVSTVDQAMRSGLVRLAERAAESGRDPEHKALLAKKGHALAQA